MGTLCGKEQVALQPHGRRRVVAGFDGGSITSDAGVVLLREFEERLGILSRLAGCFTDHRSQNRIEHSVEQLVRQRVFALAPG